VAVAPERRDQEFEALYRGHVGDVYRYSLSLVRDPAEAEDVTQTTFLNAYRAYDGPLGKPQAWLLTIARNICFERYRRSQRRPRLVPLHEAMLTPAADESGIRAEEIRDALQGIPPRQRTALLLEAADGRSRAEIAEELRIGETTVTGLLMRARGNLRLQLDEGMSCRLAVQLRPQLWGTELPEARRRAAIAHLRNCERCAAEETPRRSLAGFFAALIPAMRAVTQPVVGLLPGGSAGVGAAAAVVAAAGTIAWQAAPLVQHDRPARTTPTVVTPTAASLRDAAPEVVPPRAAAQQPPPAVVRHPKANRSHATPVVTRPAPDDRGRAHAAAGAAGPTAFAVSPPGVTGPTGTDPTAGSSEPIPAATSEAGSEAAIPSTAGQDPEVTSHEAQAAAPTSSGDSRIPPGQAKDDNVPPGQAKADNTPPGQARNENVPPGQAKADNTPPGQARDDNVPPGQAKADNTPPGQARDDNVPPGQAKADNTPPGHAKSDNVPPGQAKADTTPPGQARTDNTPPGQAKADTTPPGQAKADSTPPVQAKDDSTPPGQAKADKTPPGQADKVDSAAAALTAPTSDPDAAAVPTTPPSQGAAADPSSGNGNGNANGASPVTGESASGRGNGT
jgi:RNA polymerase sigma factor (sigma-70 family)